MGRSSKSCLKIAWKDLGTVLRMLDGTVREQAQRTGCSTSAIQRIRKGKAVSAGAFMSVCFTYALDPYSFTRKVR